MANLQNYSKRASEILNCVHDFFGTTKHEVSMYEVGEMLVLEISYWNFKPKREVRNYIEGLSENIDIEILSRRFSDEVYSDFILNVLYDEEIFVKSESDDMHSFTLQNFIDGRLMAQDFTKVSFSNSPMREYC